MAKAKAAAKKLAKKPARAKQPAKNLAKKPATCTSQLGAPENLAPRPEVVNTSVVWPSAHHAAQASVQKLYVVKFTNNQTAVVITPVQEGEQGEPVSPPLESA